MIKIVKIGRHYMAEVEISGQMFYFSPFYSFTKEKQFWNLKENLARALKREKLEFEDATVSWVHSTPGEEWWENPPEKIKIFGFEIVLLALIGDYVVFYTKDDNLDDVPSRAIRFDRYDDIEVLEETE